MRFDQAVSSAPWTLPSVASLLTSLYPSQHGAITTRRPLPRVAPRVNLDPLPQLRHAAELAHVAQEPASLALTSDHGEGFDAASQRVHHGGRLHDDVLRVPLFLSAPGRLPAGAAVGETVRMVDLLPTLLELCGLAVPDGLAGHSLVPTVAWGEEFPAKRALRTRRWKLIGGSGHEEIYDLAADPGEIRPGAAELPAELRGEQDAFPQRYPARLADEEDIDAETRAQLQALGYVVD